MIRVSLVDPAEHPTASPSSDPRPPRWKRLTFPRQLELPWGPSLPEAVVSLVWCWYMMAADGYRQLRWMVWFSWLIMCCQLAYSFNPLLVCFLNDLCIMCWIVFNIINHYTNQQYYRHVCYLGEINHRYQRLIQNLMVGGFVAAMVTASPRVCFRMGCHGTTLHLLKMPMLLWVITNQTKKV